jgi:hypothetical protein
MARRVSDESDDAHRTPAQAAAQGQDFEDARQEHGPQSLPRT